MAEAVYKLLFGAAALPALLRAALRLVWLDRAHDLEALAERMARVPPWRWAWLDNPRYLEACVQRLAGWLPGRSFGPCLKRSLLLLDLWSRCGLRPRIHLGAARASGGGYGFHAWVSLPDDPAPAPPDRPRHAEIWSYPEPRAGSASRNPLAESR